MPSRTVGPLPLHEQGSRRLACAPIIAPIAVLCLLGVSPRLVAAPVGLVARTAGAFLPGIPVLVRVEAVGDDGWPDRTLWDAEVTLSASPSGASLVPDRVRLFCGIGSALVRLEGAAGLGEVVIEASLGSLRAQRTLRSLESAPVQTVSGAVASGVVEWDGVVHVTGPLTIGSATTLRLLPGALILVDGVTTPEGEPGSCKSVAETPALCGVSILVQGALEALGTEEDPVTITASDPDRAWGELTHQGARPSVYLHTIITRAGNSPRGGHTNTGPAIRSTGSSIVFDGSSITDTGGKSMQASGSELELHDTLLSRSTMGPEVDGTAVLFERSYALELHGNDDNDGIYFHDQRAGQEIEVLDSTIALGDDDGIDTLGSEVLVERSIIRDFKNPVEDSKGISVFSGHVTVRSTIIADCKNALTAKGDSTGADVLIERSTLLGTEIALEAQDKFGRPNLDILIHVNSSILFAPNPIRTDYPPGDITLEYSFVDEPWAGPGLVGGDPGFVSLPARDLRLAPGSVCIDAGDPLLPTDPDGTRADMGAWPAESVSPGMPRFTRGDANQDGGIDISDGVRILLGLFGGLPLACKEAADVDDDGATAITDVVRLLGFLFLDAAAPGAPWPLCGVDRTEDALGCEVTSC